MNLKDIESLIQFVQKSGVSEVSLEQKDFKLIIKTSHGPAVSIPVQHMAPAPVPHIAAVPPPHLLRQRPKRRKHPRPPTNQIT